MSNRLQYRHLSGPHKEPTKNPDPNERAQDFLAHLNARIKDALHRAGLWPRAIGKATAIRLIARILRAGAGPIYFLGRSSDQDKLNIGWSQLDISVCDDKWPARTAQPYLTTVADDFTGVVFAFGMSFEVPTLAVVTRALRDLPPRHTGIVCLNLEEQA